MTVTLKNVGIRRVPPNFDNPYSDTLEVLWEIEEGLEWSDPDGKFPKVVHKIAPLTLRPVYTPQYHKVPNLNEEVTYGL